MSDFTTKPPDAAIHYTELTYHAMVTRVNEAAFAKDPVRFEARLVAPGLDLEVTTSHPLPFHGAFDVVIKPAPANGKPPPIESES